MIARIFRRGRLMNVHDGTADVIGGNDVDPIVGSERKYRKAGEDAEGLYHVELGSFGAAAVTENDGRAKNGARNFGQKLVHHVLAEFLGAGVRIVIGAGPIDGGVFLDDFVLAGAGDGYGGDVGKAAEAVMILGAAGELNHLESAAQIYVEALLFGFAIEGCGAVDERVGGFRPGRGTRHRAGRIEDG